MQGRFQLITHTSLIIFNDDNCDPDDHDMAWWNWMEEGGVAWQPLKRRPVPLVASPPHSVPAVSLYWGFGTFFFLFALKPILSLFFLLTILWGPTCSLSSSLSPSCKPLQLYWGELGTSLFCDCVEPNLVVSSPTPLTQSQLFDYRLQRPLVPLALLVSTPFLPSCEPLLFCVFIVLLVYLFTTLWGPTCSLSYNLLSPAVSLKACKVCTSAEAFGFLYCVVIAASS